MVSKSSKAKAKRNLRGGLGGDVPAPLIPVPESGLVDERTPGKDLKLIQAAIRKGWIIPERAYAELPAEMLEIALDKMRDDRPRIAAAKVLTTMFQQANPPEKSGQTINVGVQVNQNDDLYD